MGGGEGGDALFWVLWLFGGVDGGGRKVYDDETLMGCIVWAEGGRVRSGVPDHCHVNCVDLDIEWNDFQVS